MGRRTASPGKMPLLIKLRYKLLASLGIPHPAGLIVRQRSPTLNVKGKGYGTSSSDVVAK
ncbi:hypothetical protein GP475_07365 [Corynebacterium poyangense]|uniref:Uncharacterized protein n=1 Tax=Corynebacterium poyangense TaxID=2684405 RepID=A0A7H0SPJ8_9CORY|nr:hypothetical protein [Corynebacterium poyangense]MBZ8178058.1 hypothetical protein [Corynebacterium poyangense]QNQ90473.1 hypothetical protein GP475_07365 [Corynebacterium poyangense]